MYNELPSAASSFRKMIIDETNDFLAARRTDCDKNRSEYFKPDFSSSDAYKASVDKYRQELIAMLGYPLSRYADFPEGLGEKTVKLFEDEHGFAERICIELAPGLHSYGLLFTPKNNEKCPLTVAFHGGAGTPEILSSFYNESANYNHLVERIRSYGNVMVYAPQLILWSDEYEEEAEYKNDHFRLDAKFKQLGGSLTSFELFKIFKAVDYLCAHRNIDAERMGVCGLSYGGFYTLFTAAIDTRFKAALSSCFLNDRYKYPWEDFVWFDSASKFKDPEIGALICPRALSVQVGKDDDVFAYESAEKAHEELKTYYERLGLSENLKFTVFDGYHQFSEKNGDFEWFMEKLIK